MQGAGEQKDALQLRERAVAMTRNSTRNQPAAPEEIGPPPLVSLAYAGICFRMLTYDPQQHPQQHPQQVRRS